MSSGDDQRERDYLNNPNLWGDINSMYPLSSSAGVRVTPQSSMQLSAYYACIRNISEDIAKLTSGAYRIIPTGGKEYLPKNPATVLFTRRPNREMTPATFKQTIVSHALGWGNGYAEIQRNGRGEVIGLHPIHPSRVKVERADDGEVYYRVFKMPQDSNSRFRGFGDYVDLAPDEVFHILGLGGDGLVGYSVAKFAQDSLGAALGAQKYGASFYGNGTSLGGVLEHPGQLSEEAQKRLLSSWNQKHQGPSNSHKAAILEEGMKWTATSVPPRDAQFIEGKQFHVVDIARWFRMPPHKIQDLTGAKFNNIEHQGIEYVTDTLLSWIIKIEEEIERKIITAENVQYKFHPSSFLRGDNKARSEYYRTMINAGIMSPNEARSFEDMNPGPDALNGFFMQSAMATLEQIVAGTTGTSDAAAEDTEVEDDEETTIEEIAEPAEDKMAAALRPVLHAAIERVESKQAKAMSRQEKKGKDSEWAARFFGDQVAMAYSNLSAVLTSYGNGVGWSVENHAEAAAELESSLSNVYDQRLARYEGGDTLVQPLHLEQAFGNAISRGNHADA